MNEEQKKQSNPDDILMEARGLEVPSDVEIRLRHHLTKFKQRLHERYEGDSRGWFSTFEALLQKIPTPVFVTLALLAVIITAPFLHNCNSRSGAAPCTSIQLSQATSGEPAAAPWFWEMRLRRGLWITVPENTNAEIQMQDGSTITCEPSTLIAIRYGNERNIGIRQGSILVKAEPDKEHPMIVDTGRGSVRVTGTVFRITVTP